MSLAIHSLLPVLAGDLVAVGVPLLASDLVSAVVMVRALEMRAVLQAEAKCC